MNFTEPRKQSYYSKDKHLHTCMSWPLEWNAIFLTSSLISSLWSAAHLHSNWISSAFLWYKIIGKRSIKTLQQPDILKLLHNHPISRIWSLTGATLSPYYPLLCRMDALIEYNLQSCLCAIVFVTRVSLSSFFLMPRRNISSFLYRYPQGNRSYPQWNPCLQTNTRVLVGGYSRLTVVLWTEYPVSCWGTLGGLPE